MSVPGSPNARCTTFEARTAVRHVVSHRDRLRSSSFTTSADFVIMIGAGTPPALPRRLVRRDRRRLRDRRAADGRHLDATALRAVYPRPRRTGSSGPPTCALRAPAPRSRRRRALPVVGEHVEEQRRPPPSRRPRPPPRGGGGPPPPPRRRDAATRGTRRRSIADEPHDAVRGGRCGGRLRLQPAMRLSTIGLTVM